MLSLIATASNTMINKAYPLHSLVIIPFKTVDSIRIKLKSTSLLCMFLSLVLSGCSTLPDKTDKAHKNSPNTNLSTQERIQQLKSITQWEVKSKIAFIEKDKRNSFTLFWQVDEQSKQQKLNLTSYLGINVLKLRSNESTHELTVDGNTYNSNDLPSLIYNLTGMTLPVDALNLWLKGLPYQPSDIISYHQETRLPSTLANTYKTVIGKLAMENTSK